MNKDLPNRQESFLSMNERSKRNKTDNLPISSSDKIKADEMRTTRHEVTLRFSKSESKGAALSIRDRDDNTSTTRAGGTQGKTLNMLNADTCFILDEIKSEEISQKSFA